MTRINIVHPRELCDQHLLAEYRELPRVFQLARAFWERGGGPIPERYTLGPGHVTFFYNKCGWLITRQFRILGELNERGFSPQFSDPKPLVRGLPSDAFRTWTPSFEEAQLNRQRIELRLSEMKRKPRWTKPNEKCSA